MSVVVTGASGTVGRHLVARLQEMGRQVLSWDRIQVPPTDSEAVFGHLLRVRPEAVYHLGIASRPTGLDNEAWRVNVEWAQQIAVSCRELKIPMIFTSTVMVFADSPGGPFDANSEPDATEGYGFEKRTAEEVVRLNCPKAHVVRLGWQIGRPDGSNNMAAQLQRQMSDSGRVSASTRWYPACSLLQDTAAALVRLEDLPPGTYMVDSNRGWTFHEIASALAGHLRADWQVEASDQPAFDQRMLDERLQVASLRDTLTALRPL